jgi:molybdenum cofactor cytidylyltransferase
MFNQIIVSQSSEGWKGVPVLFDKCYFKELSDLKGDEGAKKVFLSHNSNVIALEAGDILDDLDSREAYEKLLAKFNC